ncbi:MAG: YybH family protein [Gemmatimonadota bacterium]
MLSIPRTLMVSLAVAALAACTAGGGGGPAVDVEAEAQAIRDISAHWLESVQARDLDAVAGVFATDAATIFDGDLVEGLDAIRSETEEEWSENPDFTVSWTTMSVDVAGSGDLAYERGSFTFDPDGPGEAQEAHGEYVTVYKKIDGQWKVVVDAGTTLKGDEDAEEGEGEDTDEG